MKKRGHLIGYGHKTYETALRVPMMTYYPRPCLSQWVADKRFAMRHIPQTFLKFEYFRADFSSADWRDITFMSALTASASSANLWDG